MAFPLSLPEQAANNAMNQFSNYLGRELGGYRQRWNQIFNVRLSDSSTNPPTPMGQISAADILEAMGTNAGAVMKQLSAHYDYIHAINPSGLKEQDAVPTHTINEDGTVILTPLPEE